MPTPLPRSVLRIAVASLALTLSACAADDADPAARDTTTSSETTAASSTTAASETSATETETTQAAATEVEVTDARGTITVPVEPETVVVMDLGIALSLDALGVEMAAIGGLPIDVPEPYADVVDDPSLTDVGTAFEPDLESINALSPDLILLGGRSASFYDDLSGIAPTVDLTADTSLDFLDSARTTHETLGAIFGVSDEVEAALADAEERWSALAEPAAAVGPTLFVMTNGAEVSAYGPGSRFGLVYDAGFTPAEFQLDTTAEHGDAISFEFILEASPDVLFVLDRGAATGQSDQAALSVLDNDLVAATPAWQNDRVVVVDAFAWYIATGSLPALEVMLDDLETAIG